MRSHHLVQIVSRLSRSLRETLNFERCNAYPLVPTVSRLSGLCLAFLLLGAHPGLAQRTLPDYSGITAGDRVQVTLQGGMSLSGHLMRMTDSTLVLSATKAPIAVLQLRSLPLEVSQTSVTLLLSNGSRVTGQVVGRTEQRLVFRKEGATGNVFVERSEVVAVSNRGRKAGESAIVFRHGEIAKLDRLNSPVSIVLLEPGVRVRVKARELGKSPVIGTVVSVNDDGILLLQPIGKDSAVVEQAPVSFPVASANSFEISQGVRTYPEWTVLKGLGIGAGLGTVGGVILYSAKSNEFGSIYAVPVGSIVGASVGLLYGVISAVYEKPTEQWQTVPKSRIRLSLGTPRRDRFDPVTGGLAVNMAFRF